MISALVVGELIADPVQRQTREGKPFTTATLRVPAGPESVLVGLATFSETASARLLQMTKGGAIAATGTLEVHAWVTRDGDERQGWRLTAVEVLTHYAATKRRKAAEGSDA